MHSSCRLVTFIKGKFHTVAFQEERTEASIIFKLHVPLSLYFITKTFNICWLYKACLSNQIWNLRHDKYGYICLIPWIKSRNRQWASIVNYILQQTRLFQLLLTFILGSNITITSTYRIVDPIVKSFLRFLSWFVWNSVVTYKEPVETRVSYCKVEVIHSIKFYGRCHAWIDFFCDNCFSSDNEYVVIVEVPIPSS